MYTWTTYGTWLRGDSRGWVENGITFPPSPPLEAFDRNLMKYEPWYFDETQLMKVGQMIGNALRQRRKLSIFAMTVQAWHIHLITSVIDQKWHATVKCAKDAIRWGFKPGRPIWTEGFDKRFCFDEKTMWNRIEYVQKHNIAMGWNPDPWDFLESPLSAYDSSIPVTVNN